MNVTSPKNFFKKSNNQMIKKRLQRTLKQLQVHARSISRHDKDQPPLPEKLSGCDSDETKVLIHVPRPTVELACWKRSPLFAGVLK